MKAYIERIYGGMARVLFGDDESVAVDVPVGELPRGAGEGQVLSTKFLIDDAATARRKARLARLGDGE